MAGEYRTDTPGFARRVAQFEVEDVYVHLAYDPRLRFYIPKRWWVNERFDMNVQTDSLGWHSLPHLEVNVGKRITTLYRPRVFDPAGLALMAECLAFAREVLIEA